MQQWTVAQPVQQFITVVRVQYLIERVFASVLVYAFGDCQQVQVVVAEYGDRIEFLDEPECGK